MATTSKKLVAYHISRLSDKDRDVRLKAIEELRLLGDMDALEALKDLYDNDDDTEVRKAAQEAGRDIYKQQ